jgi:cell division protein FtsN
MSILDSNITEEERISGYRPNETGDDTFMLEELDSYPGVLPDFSYEEEPLIPSESPFEDNEEFDSFEETSSSDDSIEDINLDDFDLDNLSGLEVEEGSNYEYEEETPETTSGAFEDSDADVFTEFDNDPVEFDPNSFKFDDNDSIEELSDDEIRALEGDLDDYSIENDEVDDLNDSFNDDFSSENQESNNDNDGLELDDDLKNLLKKDLKKSKERKGDDFNFDDEIEVVRDEEFPIDEDMSADVMNFSDIDADKPSNYGIDKVDGEETKSEKEVFEEKLKENKKLSKRMIYVYSGVAVTLLMALLITAILNKDNIFNDNKLKSDSTLVEDNQDEINEEEIKQSNKDNIKTKEKSKTTTKKADEKPEPEDIEIDDVTLEEKKDTIKQKEIVIEEKKETPKENINLVKDANEIEKVENQQNVVSEDLNLKNESKKKEVKQKPVKEQIKKEIPKTTNITDNRNNQSKPVTNNKSKVIEPKSEVVKSEQSSKIPENNKNLKVAYPKKEQSDEGLFIVQIYASQSKEDANFWLKKLKEQNINDAFISEQIVRDEIWYRVRFGSFATKTEALETASKLGYAQTWVDRVK